MTRPIPDLAEELRAIWIEYAAILGDDPWRRVAEHVAKMIEQQTEETP